MRQLPVPRQPGIWLAAFIVWAAVLWFLSSFTPDLKDAPRIPFSDKIAHFGYFFGGGGLLAAFLYFRNPRTPSWRQNLAVVAIVCAIVGALDEFHQTFTPRRSGNDPYDWLADVLGSIGGARVFRAIHRWIK